MTARDRVPVVLILSVEDVEGLGTTDSATRAYLDLACAQAMRKDAMAMAAEVTADIISLPGYLEDPR